MLKGTPSADGEALKKDALRACERFCHAAHNDPAVGGQRLITGVLSPYRPSNVALYLAFRTIIDPIVHPLTTARCFLRSSRPHDRVGVVGGSSASPYSCLRALAPALIVLEATGGYETALVAALAAASLPVVVANPRQVRDFAQAMGQLAKTDRLDAQLLALFAEPVHPTPRPLPDAVLQHLDALMTRRRQLLDMLTAERNRLEHSAALIRREIIRHLRWLERRVGAADHDLDDTIQKSPVWRAKEHCSARCQVLVPS